jgi:microcystin-dependent protein
MDSLLAEIKFMGCNFAPRGFALCNGQLLSISQNTALFSLLGTQYGGDGRVTFGLPNFQGASPMSQGTGPGLTPRVNGETGGSPTVTLLTTEMPQHNHLAAGFIGEGGQTSPTGNTSGVPSFERGLTWYSAFDNTKKVNMNALALGLTGNNQAHNNLMPYLVVTMVIATQGVFPARN